MKRSMTAMAAVMMAAGAGLGQDLGVKAAPQTRPIAIVGATAYPVSGPPIEDCVVVFDKGVLTRVSGGGGYFDASPDVDVINATGLRVYPGLISAYTQLGITEIPTVRASNDFNEAGSISPEARSVVAVNPDSWLFPVTRANGILTAGVFPSGGVVPGRAGVVRLDGWTWEQMAVDDDAGLVVSWPMMRTVTAWWMTESEEDQLKNIRQNLHTIDEAFKTAKAYIAAKDADPGVPVDLRWEAMRGVFPGGAGQNRVFIMAGALDQITAAVSWAAPLGLRPVIVGGAEAPLAAELLKKHDVPVIVMGTHNLPRRDDSAYDEAFTLPARLEAAGVTWCLASGEETPHDRSLPHNAGRAAAYGLSKEAALRSITLSAAEVLGVADRLGSLETGKAATLIITDGDPLEVTTRVTGAFIDGRKIDLSSKQSVLAEKYRAKYRQQRGE